MNSRLRRHWSTVIIAIVVGYVVLGFPPGVPSIADIEIEMDKTFYVKGDRADADFYLVNRYPWPIRMQPYNRANVFMTYEGEPTGAGYMAHLDWAYGQSIYLAPGDKHEILTSYRFTIENTGNYSIVVELYGHDALITHGQRSFEVTN